jgi:hypothetical protein
VWGGISAGNVVYVGKKVQMLFDDVWYNGVITHSMHVLRSTPYTEFPDGDIQHTLIPGPVL